MLAAVKGAKRLIPMLILVSLLAAAHGCAGGGGPTATTQVGALLESQSTRSREVSEMNAKLFSSVSTAPEFNDYIISEGDLLEITIYEAEDLKTSTRVSARGFVTLPLIGSVELKGLSTREAEQKIEDLYRANYIHDPHANLFVKEQYGGKITVLGAVKTPGTYDYLTRRKLMDVLALAGGLTPEAGKMVHLRRAAMEQPERPETYLVDMDQLIKEGHAELNLEVQKGDVVFVPNAGVVYVDGAVRKPGSYPIKQSMSVREAIVQAGGFGEIASEDHVKLIRDTGAEKREVVELSLADKTADDHDKLVVQDGDIIFVESNLTEKLIYGLRFNALFGLVGLGYQPPYTPQTR